MGGIAFLQTGFLIAAAAGLIPIVIHLLLRQKARRVHIGSLRFILPMLRQQRRMQRLRQWLLLLLRVAFCVLLALLFARPYWDTEAQEARLRETVLLLDTSASMRLAGSGDETAFDRAYRALRQRMAEIPEETVLHVAAYDSDRVREIELDDIGELSSPGFGGTDHALALAWARDVLQSSNRPQQEIYMYSDLQRVGLMKTRLRDFPPNIAVHVVDVGNAVVSNLALARVEAVSTEIRPRLPPTLAVEVWNAGPLTVEDVRLRLRLQGPREFKLEREVTIEGAGQAHIEFPLEDAAPGIYQGFVELGQADGLNFDNRRYVAFEARHPDRLLIVDGEEGRTAFFNETYYLEMALRLGEDRLSTRHPTYETQRIVWEQGEGFPDLAGFRAIILANVGRSSETDAQRLRQYLKAGGNLIVTGGGQMTSTALAPLIRAGLLPVTAVEPGRLRIRRVADWDREHPIFAPFAEAQHGDLRALEFRRVTRVTPSETAQILAKLDTGEPLLLEQEVGRGRSLLLTASVDREGGDWPQSRLFVPVVRQIVGYATGQHERREGVREIVAGQGNDEAPGIRQVEGAVEVRNVDPEESRLERITVEEFAKLTGLPEVAGEEPLDAQARAALEAPPGSQRADEIWTRVLWALLLVSAVELLLSTRVLM